MEKAGRTTIWRGIGRIGAALREPRVLFVVVGLPLLILVLDFGINWGVRVWMGWGASGTLFGFVLGVGVSASFLILLGLVAVLAGGVNWITGGLAERESGKVLDNLGPQWRVAHNVAFTIGRPPNTWPVDVDHLAVGPYGVLVVESKYSTSLLAPEDIGPRNRDVRQVERNTALVRELLDASAVKVPLVPVLVYWGYRPKVPENPVLRVGDVRVVYGIDAERWLPRLAARTVSPGLEDAAWRVVAEYAEAAG